MAKINAYGCRLIAVVDTERTIPIAGEPDVTYREKWRIRSDGAVLRRIVWTESADRHYHDYAGHPTRLRHNSGYALTKLRFKADHELTREGLVNYLQRRGFTIIDERASA